MALHYKQEAAALAGSRKTLQKMLALIPALALAVLCYSVTVYAWFSASIVNTGNVIATTTYGLDILVRDENEATVQPSDGVYNLETGHNYTVTLTKTGGASTGYCVVKEGENTYYTAPITEGSSFTFTIAEAGSYTFTAVWGVYTGEGTIPDGGSIGNPTNGLNALPATEDTAPTSSEPTTTSVQESAATTQPTEHQTQQPVDPTESSSVPSTDSEKTNTIPESSSSAPSETEPSSTVSAAESPESVPAEKENTAEKNTDVEQAQEHDTIESVN